MGDPDKINEWEERAIRLLYYGDANVDPGLEDQAMAAFANILKMSKVERRPRNVALLMEFVVEHEMANPKIIEAIENQVLFNSYWDFAIDIVSFMTIENGKPSKLFSPRFYDALFMQALQLMPNKPSADIVRMAKVFEDRRADVIRYITSN